MPSPVLFWLPESGLSAGEWNYLVYGATGQRAVPPKPAHAWLSQSMWQDVVMLSQMEAFQVILIPNRAYVTLVSHVK